MPISKTDFVRGLQCEKMLWLDAHAPELKIIPPEVQARLDAGNAFGDDTMGIFGDYVETTAYKADGRLDYAKMLQTTQDLLEKNCPIVCEATFSWYGNYCAVDILKKDGDGYALYEVKNSDTLRKEFITDLGFQRLIVKKSGVSITSSHLILPCDNAETDEDTTGKTYVEYGGKKYVIIDVTSAAKAVERVADRKIFALGKIKKKDAPMPCIAVGEHCNAPYRCWYYSHCHDGQEKTEKE